MCGISFYFDKEQEFKGQLENSLRATQHRGPDSNGIYVFEEDFGNIGLGHNRLSILDLSVSGSQPLRSNAGNWIIYNGEIYNHVELRNLLSEKGIKLSGGSDTEVIANLYDIFGPSSFKMLKGMFAFLIYDIKEKKLLICRDAVGIKPLYIYESETGVFGCSEIKGLKEFTPVSTEIDVNDIYEFFNNGFLYEPATGFKAIKKLLPGHCLEIDLVNNIKTDYQFTDVGSFNNEKPLDNKIADSVKKQQVADVPLGIFFSGGADSSILAKYYNDAQLFFAKYESSPEADVDYKYSNLISDYLNKELKVVEIGATNKDEDALLATVDFVAKHSEELISDYTFWATYQLAEASKEAGYKVMLSGMGGDEAFAGYPRYVLLKFHKLVRLCSLPLRLCLSLNFIPKKLSKKFERLVSYSNESSWLLSYSRLLGYFSRKDLAVMFDQNDKLEAKLVEKLNQISTGYMGNKSDKIKFAQYMDGSGFLAHNLMVADKASMLASIELRVPLLDESVFAHGMQLGSKELVYKRQAKYPLKHILSKILPNDLIERPKTGFNPPLETLVNGIGKERLKQEIKGVSAYVNVEPVFLLIDEHFNAKRNNTYKIWQMLYFSRWLKHNL